MLAFEAGELEVWMAFFGGILSSFPFPALISDLCPHMNESAVVEERLPETGQI